MSDDITCPHCGNVWPPRVNEPLSCPKCKRYLKETPLQRQKRLDRAQRHEELKVLKKEAQLVLIEQREDILRHEGAAYVTCSHLNCLEPAWFHFKHAKDARNFCKKHLFQHLESIDVISFTEVLSQAQTH